MSRSLFVAAAAGLALAAGTVSAAPITLLDNADQSGFAGQTTAAPGVALATFDFTGQAYASLTSIDSIVITLSINDGDTAAGEFDFGDLNLYLDGINTGLALNGFSNNNIVTLTLQQPNPAILAALLDNGQLNATIADSDPADGGEPGNFISLPGGTQNPEATLEINGQTRDGGPGVIPLPAAVLVAPLCAGLAGMYSRRFRRK